MSKSRVRWTLSLVVALALGLAPIVATALPPRPGGGSCQYCKGHFTNRYCETAGSGGYEHCDTDTWGNCIAHTSCGSSLTVTP